MLKLSKMTDYAVVILAEMASLDGQLLTAGALAQHTKVPEPTVSKILKLLVKQNLVASTRGSNGGYTLSKSPNDINMAHVIMATDGPVTLTACVESSGQHCDLSDNCNVKGKWNPVNQAMQNALENVSLQQMIGGRA